MDRDQALALLRQHEAEFRKAGIGALFLFGSVARDQAGVASDVDVFFDLERTQGFTLFDLSPFGSACRTSSEPRSISHPSAGASPNRSRRGAGVSDSTPVDSLLDILELSTGSNGRPSVCGVRLIAAERFLTSTPKTNCVAGSGRPD
jgi:hypothetical protein